MKFLVKEPNKSKPGIYIIKNNQNGRFYIGSTKNLFSRYKSHLYQLKKNEHGNKFLQNDWNKYKNSAEYEFNVVELINNPDTRLIFEQKWLDKMFQKSGCMNIKSKVNRKPKEKYSNNPEETKRKISAIRKENWKDPDYREKQVKSQKKTKNSKAGKEKQSKISKRLWRDTSYRAKVIEANKKHYSIVDPDGNLVSFTGVSDFVANNNLSMSSFYKLIHGEIYQHKGWTLPGTNKQEMLEKTRDNRARPFAKTYEMVAPNGEKIIIHNMKKFCEKNQLCKSSMLRVHKGQYKQHKGWKRYP